MRISKVSLSLGATAAFVLACSGSPDASNEQVASDGSSLTDPGNPTTPTQTPPPPPDTTRDSDGDGVTDAIEARVAAEYMPFVSIHTSDTCKTRGIVYRVAKHPRNAGRLTVWAVVLYDKDCGAGGHAGDDEAFGFVVDPTKRGAAAILAVRAISHQGTWCEHVSDCGVCPGMNACTTVATGQGAYPVVFASKNKHGNYVAQSDCDGSWFCDSGGCFLQTPAELQSANVPMVNVGEPTHPLVTNLTTQGFITAANGWHSTELLNFNPWHPGDFGGAGDLSGDLVDNAFVIDTAACH